MHTIRFCFAGALLVACYAVAGVGLLVVAPFTPFLAATPAR